MKTQYYSEDPEDNWVLGRCCDPMDTWEDHCSGWDGLKQEKKIKDGEFRSSVYVSLPLSM